MKKAIELYKRTLQLSHLPGVYFVYKVLLDDENNVDVEIGNIKDFDLSILPQPYRVMDKDEEGNQCAIKINSPNLFFIDHSSHQFLLRLGSELEDINDTYNCHCHKEELELVSAFHPTLIDKAVRKIYPRYSKIKYA